MFRSVLVLAFALPLALPLALVAGCSTRGPDPFLTAAVGPAGPPLVSEVAPGFAVALLPPTAGPIRSVRQTHSDAGLTQEIVYANATGLAGENRLTVRFPPEGPGRSAFLRAPSERAIRAEIARAFPGERLTIDSRILDNPQGGFGFAQMALPGGGACLYAWQLAVPQTGETTLSRALARTERAQIRLRFCHPSIPPERIAALMQGLRLKPVNRELIEWLRFAAGSGSVAAVDLAPAPAVAAAKPLAEAPAEEGSRAALPSPPARPVRPTIRQPVTVPMPAAPALEASAKPVVPATPVRAAVAIPLPEAVALAP